MIETHKSLLAYNTFAIKAYATYFATYTSIQELQELLNSDIARNNSLLILGGGSNMLFTDDFEGLVLHSQIKGIQTVHTEHEAVYVEVGAGETWDNFVAYCVQQNWYGAENLSGIPGQVGASAVQNIGAYGAEAKDIIHTVICIDLQTGAPCRFDVDELDYGYRHSRFKTEWKDRYIITSIIYRLSLIETYRLDYGGLKPLIEAEGQLSLQAIRNAIIRIRNAKLPDPAQLGNAGSFFMNPIVPTTTYQHIAAQYESVPHFVVSDDEIKIPAAWLIEQSGWKGRSLGKAGIHDIQPLVLINLGGASGQDILNLATRIVTDVKTKFNITLHREIIVI